jgi:hypothetical protein
MPVPASVPCLLLALTALPALPGADDVLPLGATGLTLAVPAGWHLDRTTPGTLAVLRSPPPPELANADPAIQARGCAALAVVVATLDPADTQGGFSQRCIADLGALLTDYDPHDRDFQRMIGQREFQYLGYSFRTGQLDWEQELYVTSANGQAVVLTCGSDALHFKHWQPVFTDTVTALGAQPR